MPSEHSAPRISFFRHGESISNAGAATSDPATIPLTEHGRGQAEHISQAYETEPTLIVVSVYERTRQTAAPLIARFSEVPVEVWPVQEFTYLEPSRCVGTTGADRRPWVEHYWNACGAEYRDGPGAESFLDLIHRVKDVRARLEVLPAGSQVAVFSHGQFLQALRLVIHFPALGESAMKDRFQALDRKHPIENGAQIKGLVQSGRLFLLDQL